MVIDRRVAKLGVRQILESSQRVLDAHPTLTHPLKQLAHADTIHQLGLGP